MAAGVDAPAEDELLAFAKARLPGFMAPKSVVFGPLPKTSTGKIQKFELRAPFWEGRDKAVS